MHTSKRCAKIDTMNAQNTHQENTAISDIEFEGYYFNDESFVEEDAKKIIQVDVRADFSPSADDAFRKFFRAVATYDFRLGTPEHELPSKEERTMDNTVFYDVEEVIQEYADRFSVVSMETDEENAMIGSLFLITEIRFPKG